MRSPEPTSAGRCRATTAPAHRTPLLLWLSVALALAAVAAATWWIARRPAVTTRMEFAIPFPEEMSVSHMALSRDGSMLAFVSPEEQSALPMLYVERIGSPSMTPLPGTLGASYPFWSPDGTYIGFFANGKLQKIPVSGGPPQVLASVLAARGGSWGSRDVIIFSPDSGAALWRVNADGSGAAPLTQEFLAAHHDQDTHRWPVFLPDGNHFLFWAGNFGNSKDDRTSGIHVGSLDAKEWRLILPCRSSFGYDSHALFYADDQRQLVSVAFDPSAAKISGRTSAIANGVGFQPSTYWAALTVAGNGTLVYNTGVGAALSVLTWMDRSGKELGRIGDPAVVANPSLSPDDSRVAVDISDLKSNNVDVWLESTKGAGNSRFTFDPVEEVAAVWSRDGKTLAYRANLTAGVTLFSKQANGLEKEKPVLKSEVNNDIVPNSWSLDGQRIICTNQAPSHWFLISVPTTGGAAVPFLQNQANQSNGQISPDGKWVAYASDESGIWEVYVTSFPGGAGKWQVSRGGGTEPRWRGDGKEMFYIGASGILMAVAVNSDSVFATGTPMPLFQIHGRASISSTDIFTYDVTKDGKRFLVNRYVRPEHVPPLTILLNAAASKASP